MPTQQPRQWGKYGKWILQGPDEQQRAADAHPVRLRLFCVPQAGCGAWSFHGWSRHLPADVEVMPLELPGRNSRMGESKDAKSVAQLASEIVDAIQSLLPAGVGDEAALLEEETARVRVTEEEAESRRPSDRPSADDADNGSVNAQPPPYALFGHSMGAWVVYEMAREIRRRRREEGASLAMPLKLYVCGNRAPHLSGKEGVGGGGAIVYCRSHPPNRVTRLRLTTLVR